MTRRRAGVRTGAPSITGAWLALNSHLGWTCLRWWVWERTRCLLRGRGSVSNTMSSLLTRALLCATTGCVVLSISSPFPQGPTPQASGHSMMHVCIWCRRERGRAGALRSTRIASHVGMSGPASVHGEQVGRGIGGVFFFLGHGLLHGMDGWKEGWRHGMNFVAWLDSGGRLVRNSLALSDPADCCRLVCFGVLWQLLDGMVLWNITQIGEDKAYSVP